MTPDTHFVPLLFVTRYYPDCEQKNLSEFNSIDSYFQVEKTPSQTSKIIRGIMLIDEIFLDFVFDEGTADEERCD
jgi:hypothetical protein